MADRQLNPGDQHYGVLVDPNRRPPSVEEEAASGWSHDYSNDFSNNATGNGSLRDMEKSATNRDKDINNDSSNRGRRDLGKSERSAGFDSSAFDKDMSSKNIDKSKQRKLGGFKKTVLISGITVLSGAGMGIGISGILSGPAQLLQAANAIKDFQLAVINAQKSVRAMRNMMDLQSGIKGGVGDYFKRSRLGTTGNFLADRMEKRLAKNGVQMKTNILGAPDGISIDISNKSDAEIEKLKKDLDISDDKMKVADVDGKKSLQISRNISDKQARRVISTLDDPGKSRIISFMQTRLTTKRLGYTSWLHPFQKGKNYAKMKLMDFIEDRAKKITSKFLDASKTDETADQEAEDEKNEQQKQTDPDADNTDTGTSDGTSTDEDKALRSSSDGIQEVSEKLEKTSPRIRAVTKKVTGIASKIASKVSSAGNIVVMAVSVVCMIKSMGDEVGPNQMTGIVFPAIKVAATILGYASQIQAAHDVSMAATKLASKSTMGDMVPITDQSGDIIEGQTKFSSYWDSITCIILAQPTCPTDPYTESSDALNSVGNPRGLRSIKIIDALYKITDEYIFSVPGVGFVAGSVCKVIELADEVTGFVADNILSGAIGLLDKATDGKVSEAMGKISELLLGKAIDIVAATPKDIGNIAAHGSNFMANAQAIESGGKKLSSSQARQLNLENREFLAWRNKQKPLLARIADPTDYNSAISQLARASRWHTGESSFSNGLANIFRSLTSMPTVLASSAAQLSGTSAYAAGADVFPNEIGHFAYDSDEANELMSSDKYNTIDNTNTILGKLAGKISIPDTTYDKLLNYSKQCLGFEIDYKETNDDGTPNEDFGKLNPVDNQDGKNWNYLDFNGKPQYKTCTEDSTKESFKQLRIYVMDYANIENAACYYGDDKDGLSNSICSDIGFKKGSSDSGDINTDGNQDPQVMLEAFQKDVPTKNTSVGAYRVGSNGCTTVSAWWVMHHTKLTYGHGNGGQVVKQLYDTNKAAFNNAGVSITNTPTKAPSLFSTYASSMGAVSTACGGKCGHVGLVVSIDPDGTIYTLETYSGITNGTAHIVKHPRSDWEGGTEFIYVGGELAK